MHHFYVQMNTAQSMLYPFEIELNIFEVKTSVFQIKLGHL